MCEVNRVCFEARQVHVKCQEQTNSSLTSSGFKSYMSTVPSHCSQPRLETQAYIFIEKAKQFEGGGSSPLNADLTFPAIMSILCSFREWIAISPRENVRWIRAHRGVPGDVVNASTASSHPKLSEKVKFCAKSILFDCCASSGKNNNNDRTVITRYIALYL